MHYALWNHTELLHRSDAWYFDIFPNATAAAAAQGYSGVRWPKMACLTLVLNLKPTGEDLYFHGICRLVTYLTALALMCRGSAGLRRCTFVLIQQY
jgi:hypothetical protein